MADRPLPAVGGSVRGAGTLLAWSSWQVTFVGIDGPIWRLVCGYADRSRVRQVPLHGLRPYGESPLSAEACLDPAYLADPGRFYPTPPPIRPDLWETTEDADGVEVEALSFASAAPFGIAANDRVNVRFYRPARRAPFWNLLIIHGIWRQDTDFEDKLCRDFARHGVSCALMTLPFHWQRAVPGAPSGAYFLSSDPLWTSAAFRQTIIDARGVLELLRGRGVPVGVIGFSLGGIVAHILMSLEPLDLGVSALAGGNTAGIVWESMLTRAHRQAMEARGVTYERLSSLWATGDPTRYAERGRPPRLLMLNARYDRLVPLRFTKELWEALEKPPIHWLPAGHITAFLFRRTILNEVLGAMELPRPIESARRFAVRISTARSEERCAA
jgi:dienelactone hydrolase